VGEVLTLPTFEHNGISIHYEERGEGEPLLLIPGFTMGAEDMQPLIAALAECYRVIAADLPGSGRSLPQPREFTTTFYHEDARHMAALLRHLNTGPAHVAGFSDGGEVALLMAIYTPDLVRTLIVWGAAGTLDVEGLPGLIDAIGNVVSNPTEELQGWSEYLKERYGEENARATLRSWAEASGAVVRAGGDISLPRLGEITCPTLVLAGEFDPFCPPPALQRLAKSIPDAGATTLHGHGHTIHDDQPEWFVQTLVGWLARNS
jgi:valacyclovir hydrolase